MAEPDADDDVLALIGLIALESARLEMMLATACAEVDPDGRTAEQCLRCRSREMTDRLVKMMRANPELAHNADGMQAWAIRARELLDRRGNLMHSMWDIVPNPDEEWGIYLTHLRSGVRERVTAEELNRLVSDIMKHTGIAWFAAIYAVVNAISEAYKSGMLSSSTSSEPAGTTSSSSSTYKAR